MPNVDFFFHTICPEYKKSIFVTMWLDARHWTVNQARARTKFENNRSSVLVIALTSSPRAVSTQNHDIFLTTGDMIRKTIGTVVPTKEMCTLNIWWIICLHENFDRESHMLCGAMPFTIVCCPGSHGLGLQLWCPFVVKYRHLFWVIALTTAPSRQVKRFYRTMIIMWT